MTPGRFRRREVACCLAACLFTYTRGPPPSWNSTREFRLPSTRVWLFSGGTTISFLPMMLRTGRWAGKGKYPSNDGFFAFGRKPPTATTTGRELGERRMRDIVFCWREAGMPIGRSKGRLRTRTFQLGNRRLRRPQRMQVGRLQLE